jgi:hypothetical protein
VSITEDVQIVSTGTETVVENMLAGLSPVIFVCVRINFSKWVDHHTGIMYTHTEIGDMSVVDAVFLCDKFAMFWSGTKILCMQGHS